MGRLLKFILLSILFITGIFLFITLYGYYRMGDIYEEPVVHFSDKKGINAQLGLLDDPEAEYLNRYYGFMDQMDLGIAPKISAIIEVKTVEDAIVAGREVVRYDHKRNIAEKERLEKEIRKARMPPLGQ